TVYHSRVIPWPSRVTAISTTRSVRFSTVTVSGALLPGLTEAAVSLTRILIGSDAPGGSGTGGEAVEMASNSAGGGGTRGTAAVEAFAWTGGGGTGGEAEPVSSFCTGFTA